MTYFCREREREKIIIEKAFSLSRSLSLSVEMSHSMRLGVITRVRSLSAPPSFHNPYQSLAEAHTIQLSPVQNENMGSFIQTHVILILSGNGGRGKTFRLSFTRNFFFSPSLSLSLSLSFRTGSLQPRDQVQCQTGTNRVPRGPLQESEGHHPWPGHLPGESVVDGHKCLCMLMCHMTRLSIHSCGLVKRRGNTVIMGCVQ